MVLIPRLKYETGKGFVQVYLYSSGNDKNPVILPPPLSDTFVIKQTFHLQNVEAQSYFGYTILIRSHVVIWSHKYVGVVSWLVYRYVLESLVDLHTKQPKKCFNFDLSQFEKYIC